MKRIDRITAILLQLQSKRIVTAQEIADKHEVSVRTIYRDIRSIEESGVPILSEIGVGYSIMEGYHLPPVMFTKEEALAFLTAEKLVQKFTDKTTYGTYQSALFKIKSVLRTEEKEHLENMYDHIEVVENKYLPKTDKPDNHIQGILISISNKTVVSINYLAGYDERKTERKIEPVGIFLMANRWYIIAYCWLRKDYRTFRIDRITKMSSTSQLFEKKHLKFKTYLKEITSGRQNLHTVVILVDKAIMKYIGEQKFYHGVVSERELKDKIEMTFIASSLEGFARWFMMFGDQAHIVKPISLKNRIKEIVTALGKRVK